jgi:hypothetical protein
LYDADLRKTKLGLRRMSSLVTSAPNKRELRDLVENIKTIYVFDRIHEPEEIAFLQASKRVDARVMKGQPPRWGKAARRYMAMVSRQTGGAEDEKFRDARALGLDACNEEGTVATVTESGSG